MSDYLSTHLTRDLIATLVCESMLWKLYVLGEMLDEQREKMNRDDGERGE